MDINNSGNPNKIMVKFDKIRMEYCQIIIKVPQLGGGISN